MVKKKAKTVHCQLTETRTNHKAGYRKPYHGGHFIVYEYNINILMI